MKRGRCVVIPGEHIPEEDERSPLLHRTKRNVVIPVVVIHSNSSNNCIKEQEKSKKGW